VLREQTGIDAEPLIDLYARRGAPLRLPEGVIGGCVRLVDERRAGFDRGYDAEATRLAGGIIAGVDPAGPAFAAGMRDGMRLVTRETGAIGDSRLEIAYRVADEAGERVLRYLPAGKELFDVQRLELDGRADEPGCRLEPTR
jgi:predicted metalloprotease with PDZ domain